MLQEEVTILTTKLLKQFNLTCKLDFKNVYSWNGQYNYDTNTIILSIPFISQNTELEVTNVLLHEIAHALVGSGHHHDEIWKAKCIEIGGDGKRGHTYIKKPTKWKLVCENCGNEYNYIKKPSKNTIKYGRCHLCHNKLKLIKL